MACFISVVAASVWEVEERAADPGMVGVRVPSARIASSSSLFRASCT